MAGRLGNQMFMMANCISQSIKYNRKYFFSKNQIFDLNHYKDNVYRNISFELESIPEGRILTSPYNYVENKPYDEGVTIYEGYYQSEKNFKEISKIIIDLFKPSDDFIKETKTEYPDLLNKIVTCINVRRGDYLLNTITHPVITLDYINKAAKQIDNTEVYFIISDDLDWCKKNIDLPNSKFIDVKTWRALWLMSLCNNFIISNSSFSWWGAYLSESNNKKVVAPSTWCGPGGPQNTQDVICENWISIPTKYNEGTIIPI